MADQYERDLERDNVRRAGGNADKSERAASAEPDEAEPDETEAMERKLRRRGRTEDEGDVQENRNLSGSTTWQTLADQADPHLQHARKGQAESPNDLTHEEQPKQKKRGGRG